MIKGFDHVQLAMPRGGEATAREFYGGLLGLREIPKPDVLAGRGGCWFENEHVQIHIGIEDDFRPARKAHPALLVDDLVATMRELNEKGIAIRVDEVIPGRKRFYLDDPFGNRIEFIQDGDGFSQR